MKFASVFTFTLRTEGPITLLGLHFKNKYGSTVIYWKLLILHQHLTSFTGKLSSCVFYFFDFEMYCWPSYITMVTTTSNLSDAITQCAHCYHKNKTLTCRTALNQINHCFVGVFVCFFIIHVGVLPCIMQ